MNTEQIKALYRSNFPAFLRFAFRELNPNQQLIDTWHIDVLPIPWSALPGARSRG